MIKNNRQNYVDIPMEAGIYLKRLAPGSIADIETNVPWKVVSHSPDGFEWGYAGSGPADLALNIVQNILEIEGFEGPREKCFDGTCFNAAFVIHQDVKRKFIAPLPKEGGTLNYGQLKNFVLNELAGKPDWIFGKKLVWVLVFSVSLALNSMALACGPGPGPAPDPGPPPAVDPAPPPAPAPDPSPAAYGDPDSNAVYIRRTAIQNRCSRPERDCADTLIEHMYGRPWFVDWLGLSEWWDKEKAHTGEWR